LSLTLTQPVERKADLARYLAVIDQGAVPGDDGGQADDQTGTARIPAPTRQVKSGDVAVSGKQLSGSWVVGDNPRVLYFPYVLPQRRYAVRLSADLPAADGTTLRRNAHCQVDTDAMPATLYFASRGVVLPAGQNGGLPIVTVNMPEVDVQFLRIAPEHVPAFFDLVFGNRIRGDSDDEEERGYDNSISMKGAVGAWDMDCMRGATPTASKPLPYPCGRVNPSRAIRSICPWTRRRAHGCSNCVFILLLATRILPGRSMWRNSFRNA
jgi:hypothetical protein